MEAATRELAGEGGEGGGIGAVSAPPPHCVYPASPLCLPRLPTTTLMPLMLPGPSLAHSLCVCPSLQVPEGP